MTTALTANAPDPAGRLPARRWCLLMAIRRQGGEWTTRRAARLYGATGLATRRRKTARDDLGVLTRAGWLTCHEAPVRRYFTLATEDAAS